MEAVPRMPMIWLELKEAGEFRFTSVVRQYIQLNYAEKPENYIEALRTLEKLRQSVVNVPRDFEGCNTLRKYFGQLFYLQTRVPMSQGQEAASPATWIDIFTGKPVTHDDVSYEQACVLYNLGALHSFLGAMDNRVSEEGMKTSCTHFQCAAGAFAYIRDNLNSNFSADISHQALAANISLMLGQAQECLLEKTLLDNRKSVLVARVCAQVCDYYKECLRTLEGSECGSGKRDWKKLLCMKISYFAAITDLHMGKQSEEQQKYGEAVAYFQSALNKLNEAIKLSKGQPDSIQEAMRFSMDVIGGKFNSAKKDNDFIYHESVPSLNTLTAVKGASLVKPLAVTPADPSVTGPDLFSKLIPMATHEASSLYSEEKAKLLREVMVQIEGKNQILDRFMESLSFDCVDLDVYSSVPPVLLEKCACLSVRPDAVKSLTQAMQALSGVYTDVGASLTEARCALQDGETGALEDVDTLQELQRELQKYEEAHQAGSHTNMELHQAMNQHIPNLRLLQGPLEALKSSLPQPQLSQEDLSSLDAMKRMLGKVNEMRTQRISLEKQLRDLIQKDDITSVLVTTERYQIKALFEEQLQKYEQVKGFIVQNLAAQDNILKALTEAHAHYAPVHRTLLDKERQRNCSVQALVTAADVYEDLVRKAEEGHSFYQDLDKKTSSLLARISTFCQKREEEKRVVLERDAGKAPPPRPAPRKPLLGPKAPLSCPRGALPLPAAPFPNQRMPQLAPAPPGQALGLSTPTAPLAAQFPLPTHAPAAWPLVPGAPCPGWPAQLGPQSAATPPVSGQQVPMPGGQVLFPPGHYMQSAGFPTRPAPGLPSHTAAFHGPSQPLVHGGPFQPAFPAQSRPQPGPAAVSWPSPSPQVVAQSGPVALTYPGQVRPRAPSHLGQPLQMSHLYPSFPSYPQQMSGSFQNPNQQTTVSQTTPQPPFSNNLSVPPSTPASFQGALSHMQTQFPPGSQRLTTPLDPMMQPGNQPQNLNLLPQNIPSSSGPFVAHVLDNPNPPPLAGILAPSPANLPQSQTTPGNVLTPSSMETSVVAPDGFPVQASFQEPAVQTDDLDLLHDPLKKLSIASQGEDEKHQAGRM